MKTTRITKAEAIRVLEQTGRDGSFIANVLSTSGTPAEVLVMLAGLVRAGRSVSTLSFTMPYEGVVVDGAFVPMATLRNGADAVRAHVAAAWSEGA